MIQWQSVIFQKNLHKSSVKQTVLAQFFACDFQIHKKAYPQTP